MARAGTLESAGAGGGGGGGRGGSEGERGGPGPLVQPSTCRMELPQPGFRHWPNLLTATSSYSLHQNQNHPLQTQAHPLAQLRPEGPLPEERPRTEARVCSGERPAEEKTGSDREELQEASGERGPLPDMQPQNERPSWAAARRALPGEVAVEREDIMRVAHQLRAIGDQLNTTVLHRAHAAPQWRDWRSACLQLLNFVTQTLNTLYRLT